MVIGIKTGYDDPDEDGFGAEIYYDYYVYDEFFHRISKTVSTQGRTSATSWKTW